MTCKACVRPAIDAIRGCHSWRETQVQSIATAAGNGFVNFTPRQDSRIDFALPTVGALAVAGNFARVSMKDQSGNDVMVNAHTRAVGIDIGATAQQQSFPSLRIMGRQGIPLSAAFALNAAEAAAVPAGLTMIGNQDRGCLDAPACVQPSDSCRPLVQSFRFDAAAGVLPTATGETPDLQCAPVAPMMVSDVLLTATDGTGLTGIMLMGLSQEGDALAPPAAAEVWGRLSVGVPKFPVTRVDSTAPLQVAFSGDAPANASSWFLTLVGYRADCGCGG